MDDRAFFSLPWELIEAQLSTIELIEAMYPNPGDIEIPASTVDTMSMLKNLSLDPNTPPPQMIPPFFSFALNLFVSSGPEPGSRILINISVPLKSSQSDVDEAPPLTYTLRQPAYLTRAELLSISEKMPKDDIFAAFEFVQDEVARTLDSRNTDTNAGGTLTSKTTAPLVRVWFYFPSLSTRSKRDDLVNHAPSYGLTGFVLAGKPGVLCLEGTSVNVDQYMKFIKTDSWGDIPSYQKKVSERMREEGAAGVGVERVFDGMQEITDVLGERGGERANRGDMKALEAWLKGKGLGDAFEKVIF